MRCRAPGDVAGLEPDPSGAAGAGAAAAAAERGLDGRALLGDRTDGDVDLAGGARPVDLLGRLGAVAPVGGEERGVPRDGEDARRAREARQIADIGQRGHHERVDLVLVEDVAQAVEAAGHRDGGQGRVRRRVGVGTGGGRHQAPFKSAAAASMASS